MISRKPRAPSETDEHRAIASYFRKVGLGPGALAIHVRNERGSAWERMIAGQMGVMSGFPDWLFLYIGGPGAIEIKPRGFKEKLSRGVGLTKHVQNQMALHYKLREAGCWVEIAETLDEVLIYLKEYGVPLRSESISTERIRRGMENAMREIEA